MGRGERHSVEVGPAPYPVGCVRLARWRQNVAAHGFAYEVRAREGAARGVGLKMAPCGRVRSRCLGPAALLLLLSLSLSLSAQEGAGGGGLGAAGPFQSPLHHQQQQQPAQPQSQQQAAAGGLGPGGRGPRGGGSGGGWKLAEEEECREDVLRLCPKHSWANNLAVLECLQDVREVRAGAVT